MESACFMGYFHGNVAQRIYFGALRSEASPQISLTGLDQLAKSQTLFLRILASCVS